MAKESSKPKRKRKPQLEPVTSTELESESESAPNEGSYFDFLQSDQGQSVFMSFLTCGAILVALLFVPLMHALSCRPHEPVGILRIPPPPPKVISVERDGDSVLVNINTAGVSELCILPGIGETMARKIIAEREANGPFQSPEELLRVPGIGLKKLKAMEPMVAPISGADVLVDGQKSFDPGAPAA